MYRWWVTYYSTLNERSHESWKSCNLGKLYLYLNLNMYLRLRRLKAYCWWFIKFKFLFTVSMLWTTAQSTLFLLLHLIPHRATPMVLDFLSKCLWGLNSLISMIALYNRLCLSVFYICRQSQFFTITNIFCLF